MRKLPLHWELIGRNWRIELLLLVDPSGDMNKIATWGEEGGPDRIY